MRSIINKYGALLSIAGVIILFDQWTKAWVRNNIPLGDIWAPIPALKDYARLVHWNNTGAAFGMFQGLSLIFTVLAIVVSIAIIYYYPRIPRSDWPLRLALGLQLGGAIGNLIDRLLFGGYVTDFVSLGNFAVFNVADASISVGVAVLVIGVWITDHKKPIDSHEDSLEENDSQMNDQPVGESDNDSNIERKNPSTEYWGD